MYSKAHGDLDFQIVFESFIIHIFKKGQSADNIKFWQYRIDDRSDSRLSTLSMSHYTYGCLIVTWV